MSWCVYVEHQRRVQFESCVAEPLQTITVILRGSKWSCLLLRIVLQDALSKVTKNFPPLRSRVLVGDVTAFMNGRNKDLVEMAPESSEEVGESGRGEGPEAVDHCEVRARQSECSMKGGGIVATSVETLGVDRRVRTKQLGAKGKASRKKCVQCEILAY